MLLPIKDEIVSVLNQIDAETAPELDGKSVELLKVFFWGES